MAEEPPIQAQLWREIEERQAAELALRASEERLRKIFEYSNDAIFIIDPERDRILEANPKAEAMLGYSREELINSVTLSSVHPHEWEKFQAFGARVLQEGQGWTNELACMGKSGQTVPSEISAAVVSLDGRNCIIAMVRDITERKQAQAALERLAEIGQLSAMIVHEVRSPLTTVLMGLESFQEVPLPERSRRRLDLALAEAERLKNLLSEILAYAREPALDAKPLDLVAFSRDLYTVVAELPVVQGRSLQFQTALTAAWIQGDADKLKQVVINLVRNACEASPADGLVTWQLRPDPHLPRVHLQVHNSGDPIPAEVLAKLGQPFFTTKPSGNGLGIAIVKRIVEAHRGQFVITSSAEAGTTAQVVLPLASDR